MSWYIYKHTNKKNGKVYIGQTCQKLNNRWQNGKGYSNCRLFNNAIQKYGWDGFDHEILESDIKTIEEANEKEAYYIKKYNSYINYKNSNGYNMTPGGGSTGENWEQWEDEILIYNYNETGADKCLELINNKWFEINPEFKRSRQSIYTRAMRLELKRNTFWDDEKDQIIKEFYSKEGRKCSARIPGSNRKMCEWRASILGITYGLYWTNDEISILRNNYQYGYHKLLLLLPNKTKEQIKYKIVHLHLKKHEQFVCYETKEVFTSYSEAERKLHAPASTIKLCLMDNTRMKTSGNYHWCYLTPSLCGSSPRCCSKP